MGLADVRDIRRGRAIALDRAGRRTGGAFHGHRPMDGANGLDEGRVRSASPAQTSKAAQPSTSAAPGHFAHPARASSS